MTAQMKMSLRAVVVPSPEVIAKESPTRRLLGDLGHDVTHATSPIEAMQMLAADHADLLVIDVTNNNRNLELLSTLGDLPDDRRPGEVAVFSDAVDTNLRELRIKLSPSRVHLFLKPLHMHGLLTVLRKMEQQTRIDA